MMICRKLYRVEIFICNLRELALFPQSLGVSKLEFR
jgi:hypothetical protein